MLCVWWHRISQSKTTGAAGPQNLSRDTQGMFGQGTAGYRSKMTGDQSRTLKVGDRVCWGETTTDLGTVVGTAWNGVTIDWDDGHSTSIQHNDMAKVERVIGKLV